jgi:hypothetical protein
VTDEPPVFWRIPPEIIPHGCNIKQKTGPTGDACHHEIFGLTKKQARDIFKKFWDTPVNFNICNDNNCRPLTKEDIAKW